MNTMKLDGNGKGMALVLIMCKFDNGRGRSKEDLYDTTIKIQQRNANRCADQPGSGY